MAAAAAQRTLTCTFLLACLAATLLPSALAHCPEDGIYEFTFVGQWNETNQPGLYPSGAGFSPLVMATHSRNISLFVEGAPISIPGLATFLSSASGNDSATLVATAQAQYNITIDGLDVSGPLGPTSTYTVQLPATNTFRNFSAIAKVLPSSDWFVGVSNFDLCGEHHWAENGTIPLTVYDAGVKTSTLAFNDSGLASSTPEAVSVLPITFNVAPAYISFRLVYVAPAAPEEAPAPESNGAFAPVAASAYMLATLLAALVLALF